MPKAVVAFWNCVMSVDWYELTMAKRIEKLKSAVQNANNIGLAKNPDVPHNSIRTIFVAPEYAFSKECITEEDRIAEQGKATQQTDQAGLELWAKTIRNLGLAYPDILLVPGTIAYAIEGLARNRCMFTHGNFRHSFDKKEGVGEVAENDETMRFVPGTGSDLYNQPGPDGNRFLMHICRDATVEPDAGAPEVDVHIVVGRGVGRDAIRKRAGKLLIVADGGCYEVYDYRTSTKLLSCFRSRIVGCDLFFYLADM